MGNYAVNGRIADIREYTHNSRKRKQGSQYRANRAENRKILNVCEKFAQLGYRGQLELLSFAKGYVFGIGGSLSMEQEFKCVMEIGISKYEHVLESVDKEAAELLKKLGGSQ